MNRLALHSLRTWVFFSCLGLLVLTILLLTYGTGSHAAETSQGPQQTPTCAPPAPLCAQARILGYQPWRTDMRPTFNEAASNTLGNLGPAYDQINYGLTPTPESVTAARPIPHIILRGIGWPESFWLQFADSLHDPNPENKYACTLVASDCGYGVMQFTTCMATVTPPPPPGSCDWVDRARVAGELPYDVGTGTNLLIQKWNGVPSIGDNDHTVPEQWYYSVLAYSPGGWSSANDPNSGTLDPLSSSLFGG